MGGSFRKLFVRLAARIDEVADRPAGPDPLSGGRRRGADRRRVRGVANAQDLPETDPGIDVASRAQDELARISQDQRRRMRGRGRIDGESGGS